MAGTRSTLATAFPAGSINQSVGMESYFSVAGTTTDIDGTTPVTYSYNIAPPSLTAGIGANKGLAASVGRRHQQVPDLP